MIQKRLLSFFTLLFLLLHFMSFSQAHAKSHETSHRPVSYVRRAVLAHHEYPLSPHLTKKNIKYASETHSIPVNPAIRHPILTSPQHISSTIIQPERINTTKKFPEWKLGQRKQITIVIDPGHGGKDPGASGKLGTLEKNITLAISKELRNYFQEKQGIRAILTRNSDYFITLRQRLYIARKYHADLFISVHADSYLSTSRGVSVFALSEKGASSEAARWLAERENYSELGGLSQFRDQTYLVRSVLLDLSQNSTIATSLQLGGDILRQFRSFTALHSHKVEQARFVVLKSPDIPSILIETGFVSNPSEERNLTTLAYQKILCAAIVKGVVNHLKTHPIEGTHLG